jgi:glycosyltransferase involved in cell wall biosynthesis
MYKATENSLISICIPTYKRADLLVCAVESCLKQTYRNVEILISDDSPDDCSEKAILHWIESNKVRYYRNSPALKQAGNVNQLFDLAQGQYLVLLHDDDLLLSDALAKMLQCFHDNPNIIGCFGKQQLIDMNGSVLALETAELNQGYHRTDELAGIQKSAQRSALLGQFPNDGYMIPSDVAKNERYRDSPEVGDACDYDFALRLSASGGLFYFLNEFTAAYRNTDISILKSNNYSNLTYELIESFTCSDSLYAEKKNRLSKYASPAINKYLCVGAVNRAREIYFSSNYSWRQRFTIRGLVQLLLIMLPGGTGPSFLTMGRSLFL